MIRLFALTGLFLLVSLGVNAQKQDSVYQELFARAQTNLEEGDFKDAVLDLNQMVNSNFDKPEVFYHRGVAHFHLGEFEKAIGDFDKAAKDRYQSAELFGYRGLSHNAMKAYDKAGSDLERAISLGFKNPEASYQLGNIRFRSDRFQQAIKFYDIAQNGGYTSPVLFNNRGKAYLNLENYDKAIRDLSLAIDADNTLINAYRNRSVAYYHTQKWKSALADVETTLTKDPSWNEGYLIRGTAQFKLQNYEAAIEDLKKAEARSAGDENSVQYIAESYYAQENFKNSAIYFDKVIRENADDLDAWEKLGISLYKTGQYANAATALEKCTTTDALGYHGMALYQLGKSEESFKILNKIATTDFEDVDAFKFLASMQIKKELYSQAMSSYSKIIKREPDSFEAYIGRARANLGLAVAVSVHEDLQKAMSLDQSPSTIRTSGLIYFDAENYSQVVSTLSPLDNKDEQVNKALAISLYKEERFKESIPYYEALKDKRGQTLPLAIAYYTVDDMANAWKWFRKAEAEASIPSNYTTFYAHAAFEQKQYAKALSLTEGKGATSPKIARMRALSAYELKKYELALAEAKQADLDSVIARVGGFSADKLGKPEDVIAFLKDQTASIEILEPLAAAYISTDQLPAAIDSYTQLIGLNGESAEYYTSRGQLYMELEKNDAAVNDLGKALEINPSLKNARLLRGKLAFDLGQYAIAIEDLEIVKEQDKDGSLYYMLGMAYHQSGERGTAIPALLKADDRGFRSVELTTILGTYFFDTAEYEKAADRLTHAIQNGNDDASLRSMRGRSYFALENYEMAVGDFEKIEIDSYELAYEYGFSLYQQKNFEKAGNLLEKATELNPNDTDSFYYLGNAKFRMDAYGDAIKAYERAAANGMSTAILFNNLGKSYYKLDDREGSLPHFGKALSIDPAFEKARLNRGLAYFELNKYEETIDDLMELDETVYPEINPMLGESFFQLEDYQGALRYLNRSIENGDKSGETYHKRGRTLIELEQYSSALSDLNYAMQAGKKDAAVFLDRARANIFLGNDPAAMKDLNEAIAKDGSNPIAYYNRGYLRELQEKWKEAITDYRMVVSLDPEDHRAYFAMANSLVSLGQVSAALDPINKALELEQENASYFKVKGNITYRLNRNEEACGLWEKAVSLGDNKSNFYLDQYCK